MALISGNLIEILQTIPVLTLKPHIYKKIKKYRNFDIKAEVWLRIKKNYTIIIKKIVYRWKAYN